jgi:hypothetical protein
MTENNDITPNPDETPIVVPTEEGEAFVLPFADRVAMAVYFMVETVSSEGRRGVTDRDIRYAAKRWSTSVKVADGWVDRTDYDAVKVGIIGVLAQAGQP